MLRDCVIPLFNKKICTASSAPFRLISDSWVENYLLETVKHPGVCKYRLKARKRIKEIFCAHQDELKKVHTRNPTMGRAASTKSRDDVRLKKTKLHTKKMIAMPILCHGVFRLDVNEEARNMSLPSLSFEVPRMREERLPGRNGKGEPAGLSDIECQVKNKEQTVKIALPAGTKFYGCGEVGGSLERTGTRTVTWNSDAWGYSQSTSSLYQSHPWVVAVLPNGMGTVGVLADTTRRCEIDLRKESTIKFTSTYPFPIVTFGPFPKPEDVVKALANATGRIGMPPIWALGYHQCRFSYEPDSRVKEVAQTFRDKKIPCDVIWMDIDYMDGFRCFTFDKEKFPDPKGLAATLREQGFRSVWMIDPGIKEEKGYSIFDSGEERNLWVLSAKGKPFSGNVWPGPCRFPDFTMKETRDWWRDQIAKFCEEGVDGIWNDMNEPSVFNSVTKTMPESNVHRGDEELGGKQNHAYYHNVYGSLMAEATWHGMKAAHPERRPFVLTRAGYVGGQRHAATWTGDNLATWEHLGFSIPMALNLSLSGQPMCGPDIGGFAGDSCPRLFGRWLGIGSLLPFSRGHSETGTKDHEPWSFGPQCEEVCRLALARRYRLLPHLYTLFHQSHASGLPVMTPVLCADPTDEKLLEVEDSFLLGPLLVAASTSRNEFMSPTSTSVLPAGIWHRFHFRDTHPDLPLLFLKGGSILPCGPLIQSTAEMDPSHPITLLVALDENGGARGRLYEDSGDGFGYEDGDFLLTEYEAAVSGGTSVTVRVSGAQGRRERPKRTAVVRLLLRDGAQVEFEGIDGEEIRFDLPGKGELGAIISSAKEEEAKIFDGFEPLPSGEEDEEEDEDALFKRGEPVPLIGPNFHLQVAPWAGGRIISMQHKASGREWLLGGPERGGYEEYSGSEFRSAGCSEPYKLLGLDGQDSLLLEGDVGGGLVMGRQISIAADPTHEIVAIQSSIVAKAVGAGSGGVSRIVCLRIHPSFRLLNPGAAAVHFTTVAGVQKELVAEFGEVRLQGKDMPNGEWRLLDGGGEWELVNRFNVDQVDLCFLHWGGGFCNLELWSEERPVTESTPLVIEHSYEIVSTV